MNPARCPAGRGTSKARYASPSVSMSALPLPVWLVGTHCDMCGIGVWVRTSYRHRADAPVCNTFCEAVSSWPQKCFVAIQPTASVPGQRLKSWLGSLPMLSDLSRGWMRPCGSQAGPKRLWIWRITSPSLRVVSSRCWPLFLPDVQPTGHGRVVSGCDSLCPLELQQKP